MQRKKPARLEGESRGKLVTADERKRIRSCPDVCQGVVRPLSLTPIKRGRL